MKTKIFLNGILGAALLLGLAGAAHADRPHRQPRDFTQRAVRQVATRVDHRYHHNRSYPVRGHVYHALPHRYVSIRYRGGPYYYGGGVWYRPYGPRYVVVAPPIGIGVGFLPPYYTTVWFGGVPYYYADDVYYVWRPQRREYVVTRPPAGEPARVEAPSGSTEIFVYPKNGQSEAQQSTDRYECHAWAVQQSGFDPTRPSGGVEESQIEAKRADYRRAEGACLEGRGYSVK
ncbi:MAG TPA: DUF6515 family protein [Steroidobacteraceae bacterium]|nr:DUF6515 family protein [Steroidobacteraceae bacterium]